MSMSIRKMPKEVYDDIALTEPNDNVENEEDDVMHDPARKASGNSTLSTIFTAMKVS